MGEIWVTGDIHGDANQNSNVVIILGDFGLI